VENCQTCQVIRKGTNLVGLRPELAEEAFEQISGTDQRMQSSIELIKGEAGVDVLGQFPHHLPLQCLPSGPKQSQALNCLGTGGGLKDSMRVAADLLAS
jgi:hypothetical protein